MGELNKISGQLSNQIQDLDNVCKFVSESLSSKSKIHYIVSLGIELDDGQYWLKLDTNCSKKFVMTTINNLLTQHDSDKEDLNAIKPT